MPSGRPTGDDVGKVSANLRPTFDDFSEPGVIRTNFSLEDHIRNIILCNPYVPPRGDRCPINDLPNELLAHIFVLGSSDEEGDEEDDMYQENVDEDEDEDEDE